MWHELTKEFSLVNSCMQAEYHQLVSVHAKNWLSAPQPREMLAQGKANLDAWWHLLSTFAVLLGLMLMLVLVMIGEGLRAAFDVRSK